MNQRSFWAAEKYLERKGYEIIETCPPFIAAAADGVCAMVGVTYFTEGEFSDDPAPSREDYERAMIKMGTAGCLPPDTPVRTDHISVRIVSEQTAILRHHIGLDFD